MISSLSDYGEVEGVKGDFGMVMASPGFSLLKSTFGLAALMSLTGRPYMSAIVAVDFKGHAARSNSP